MGNFNLKHLVHAELDLMSFYNKCFMYIVYKTNLCTLYACGKKRFPLDRKLYRVKTIIYSTSIICSIFLY